MDFNTKLDARGLSCPLPILRTRKAIKGMESGDVLKIIATDAGAVKDFQSFCNQTGNPLLESNENGGEYIFFIKKGS